MIKKNLIGCPWLGSILAGSMLVCPTGAAVSQQTQAPDPAAKPSPEGTVLFSSQHPPAAPTPAFSSSSPTPAAQDSGGPDVRPTVPVSDAERAAITVTAYDLNLHLRPASAGEEVEARLTLRNQSAIAQGRVALDLSSTLRWQLVAILGAGGLARASFTHSPVATDADHTGYAEEAVIALPQPLAPGKSITLSVLYAGTIQQSASRLELIGTPAARADQTDWDAIVPTSDAGATALRGFGNVLWYPVSAPLALLGDGNKLFAEVAHQRRLNTDATIALHLTVEYRGDPPDGAIFDGRLEPLAHVADDRDQPVAEARGVATANFPQAPIGLRLPSLFLTAQSSASAADGVLDVVTPRPEAIPPYAEAAQAVAPLLAEWFGPRPRQPLLLLDHAGEPFADHALLVGQLAANAQPVTIAPLLVDGLTHAWFASAHPWMSEGLAEFMRLLWTEKVQGRDAAMAELATIEGQVAFAEPATSGSAGKDGAPGEALVGAGSPSIYRTKAATVWWQLREILGESTLQKALIAYRKSEAANPEFDRDPQAMRKTIERVSRRGLNWFFDDWVYHDHGLPDLSIVEVNPRPVPASAGKSGGFLVAVEVRNAGDAAAEVPVTVRSGTALTASERLLIPAHSSASTRVLFGGTPETVEVNDGSVPEVGGSAIHTRHLDVTIDHGPNHPG